MICAKSLLWGKRRLLLEFFPVRPQKTAVFQQTKCKRSEWTLAKGAPPLGSRHHPLFHTCDVAECGRLWASTPFWPGEKMLIKLKECCVWWHIVSQIKCRQKSGHLWESQAVVYCLQWQTLQPTELLQYISALAVVQLAAQACTQGTSITATVLLRTEHILKVAFLSTLMWELLLLQLLLINKYMVLSWWFQSIWRIVKLDHLSRYTVGVKITTTLSLCLAYLVSDAHQVQARSPCQGEMIMDDSQVHRWSFYH